MAKEAVTGAAALEAARREKMRRLEEMGIDPWGQRYDGAMPIAEIRARESEIIEVPSQEEGKPAEHHGPQVNAAGRIILMAGSGVTEQNIRELQEITGLHEFHFSGREPQPSAMQYINPNLYMGRPGANEATLDYTTARRVTETIAQLLD